MELLFDLLSSCFCLLSRCLSFLLSIFYFSLYCIICFLFHFSYSQRFNSFWDCVRLVSSYLYLSPPCVSLLLSCLDFLYLLYYLSSRVLKIFLPFELLLLFFYNYFRLYNCHQIYPTVYLSIFFVSHSVCGYLFLIAFLRFFFFLPFELVSLLNPSIYISIYFCFSFVSRAYKQTFYLLFF